MYKAILSLVASALLVGCTGTPLSPERLSRLEASDDHIEDVGPFPESLATVAQVLDGYLSTSWD